MKADKKKALRNLSIAKGQLDGIAKMMENDAYCIDISNQLLATISLLKRINVDVIDAHLSSCVKEAKDSAEAEEKLAEMRKTLERMSR